MASGANKLDTGLCPTCAAEWRERNADFMAADATAELPMPVAEPAQLAAASGASTGVSASGMGVPKAMPSYGSVRAEPTPVKHVPSNVSAIPSSIAPPSRVTPSMVTTVASQQRVSPNVQAPTVQHTKTRVDNIVRAEPSKVHAIPTPAGVREEPKVTGAVVPERAARVSPVAPPAGVVKTLSQ
jgi:hypothetical protein